MDQNAFAGFSFINPRMEQLVQKWHTYNVVKKNKIYYVHVIVVLSKFIGLTKPTMSTLLTLPLKELNSNLLR